ncbi:MAG: response regulator transcription factor [Deltaproteobacteria bacterium]|nr:response regulator transcription factor [Deltaproteobacteria bacterium]
MINLIVADDHAVLRQALCEMLQNRGKYNVIAQAGDGEELLALLGSHKPDLVIMDVAMPKLDGLGTLERLSPNQPCPPVLILSANDGGKNVKAALKAGARGFLPKNVGIQELEFAINSILEGKTYLSPTVTTSLMTAGSPEGALENPLSVLTKREVEILTHLADGKPNRVIGKLLHISTRTVDTHRSNILKKLNVKTNAELVKLAITNGLISI